MFKIEKPEMINKTFRLPLELVQRLQNKKFLYKIISRRN